MDQLVPLVIRRYSGQPGRCISQAEILRNYPALTPESLRAALAYAAESGRERVVPVPSYTMRFKLDENLI